MQIYLSSWSLKENIQRGDLSVEDLPQFAVSHGFNGLELMDRQIRTDSKYLEDLRKKCEKVGCGLIFDVSSDLTFLGHKDWWDQIFYVHGMLAAGKQMGASKVRIWLGGQSMSFQRIFNSIGFANPNKSHTQNILLPAIRFLQDLIINQFTVHFLKSYRKNKKSKVKHEELKISRAIEAIRQILPKAEEYQIPLCIENHWGISSLPENILKIVKTLDSPYLGTCPDFDNFPNGVDRYEGIKALASKAIHIHAKSLSFDTNGEESNIDYRRCLQILKDRGYTGTITVEYEGKGDAIEGCLHTKELILRHW